MTKIRNNIRGDSGLTDSQLMRSQNLFYQKTRKALDELEEYGIMEMNRRRTGSENDRSRNNRGHEETCLG